MAEMLLGISNQGLLQLTRRCKHFSPHGRCRASLQVLTGKLQSCAICMCRMLCRIIGAIRLMSELIVFMHYVGLLIALPCPRVTFCCVVLETRSYTCANLVALYSYLFCTLGVTCAAKRINQLSKHTRKCDVCCTILYLCCVGLYLPSVLWPQSHKVHTQSGPYRQVDLSTRLPIPAGKCYVGGVDWQQHT